MSKSSKFADVVNMAVENIVKEAKKQNVSVILSYSVRDNTENIGDTAFGFWHTSITIHDAAAHEKYIRDNIKCDE